MAEWVKNLQWFGLLPRHGFDPRLVQWVKGSGVAWIQFLAQELPYAVGGAIKRKKKLVLILFKGFSKMKRVRFMRIRTIFVFLLIIFQEYRLA